MKQARLAMRLTMIGAVAFALTLSGCGGQRPVTFGSASVLVLKGLKDALEAKSTKRVDDHVKALARNNAATADEKEIFEKIQKLAGAGDWDGARKLVDGCLDASK